MMGFKRSLRPQLKYEVGLQVIYNKYPIELIINFHLPNKYQSLNFVVLSLTLKIEVCLGVGLTFVNKGLNIFIFTTSTFEMCNNKENTS